MAYIPNIISLESLNDYNNIHDDVFLYNTVSVTKYEESFAAINMNKTAITDLQLPYLKTITQYITLGIAGSNSSLTTFNAPLLSGSTGRIWTLNNPLLSTANFGSLTGITGFGSGANNQGINFSNCGLNSINFSDLIDIRGSANNTNSYGLQINQCSATNINFSALTRIYNYYNNLSIAFNPSLQTMDFSNLSAITGVENVIGISILGNNMLSEVNLPSLVDVDNGTTTISNNNLLLSVDISAITGHSQSMDIDYNPSLTGITLNANTNLPSSCVYIYFLSNALTVASVNEILVRIDGWGNSSGVLDISSQTPSAAPDGSSGGFDGVTAKANLISRSWTVTTD